MKNNKQLSIFVLILFIGNVSLLRSVFSTNLKGQNMFSIKQNDFSIGFLSKNSPSTNINNYFTSVMLKTMKTNFFHYKFNLPIKREILKKNNKTGADFKKNCPVLESYTFTFNPKELGLLNKSISKLKIKASFPGTTLQIAKSIDYKYLFFEMTFDNVSIGTYLKEIKFKETSDISEIFNPQISTTVYNVTPELHTIRFRACVQSEDGNSFTISDPSFAYNSVYFFGEYIENIVSGEKTVSDFLLPIIERNVSRKKGFVLISKDDTINSIYLNDIKFNLNPWKPPTDNHLDAHFYPFYGNDGDTLELRITNFGGPGHFKGTVVYYNKEGFLEIQNSTPSWKIIGYENKTVQVNDSREKFFKMSFPPIDAYSDYIWLKDFTENSTLRFSMQLPVKVTHSALYIQSYDQTDSVFIDDKSDSTKLKSAYNGFSLPKNYYNYIDFMMKFTDTDFKSKLQVGDKIQIRSKNSNPAGLIFSVYYKDEKGRVIETYTSPLKLDSPNKNKIKVSCTSSINNKWRKPNKNWRARTILDLISGGQFIKDYDSTVNTKSGVRALACKLI